MRFQMGRLLHFTSIKRLLVGWISHHVKRNYAYYLYHRLQCTYTCGRIQSYVTSRVSSRAHQSQHRI